MKNLRQQHLSIAKIIILFLMISVVAGYAFAQSPSPTIIPVSFVGNIAPPLNTSSASQIKNGPLLLNANNVRTEFPTQSPGSPLPASFGLSAIHGASPNINNGGILIGNRSTTIIPSPDRSQLHIFKGAANQQQPAIRVEGTGPAFVTKYFETEIGIGTLNPQYHIDIPNGSPVMRIGGGPVPPGVSLQTAGTLQIMGGGPYQTAVGDYLQSQDSQGKTTWTASGPPRIAPIPNMSPSPALHSIDRSFPNGVTTYSTYPTLTTLEPGYWYITIFGTTGAAYSPGTELQVHVSNNQSPNPINDGRSFQIGNPPHGTAPYSVSLVVRLVPGNLGLNFSVGDNGGGGGINAPTINGISGYLIGN